MNFALCGLSGANFAFRSSQANFAQFPGPQEHYLSVVLVDTPVAGQHDPPTKSLDYSWVSVAFQPVKIVENYFGIGMTW